MTHSPVNHKDCQRLWQRVVLMALADATNPEPDVGNWDDRRSYRESPRWIAANGKDFRMACALAGWDADFIRDNFMAGKINHKDLVSAEESRQKKAWKNRERKRKWG